MFKRIRALFITVCLLLSLSGCGETQTAENQIPNAPWGASIEQVAKYYDLTFRDVDEYDDRLVYYTADKTLYRHDTDLIFAFLSLENEAGEANSYLYGAILNVYGLTANEAMACYDQQSGSILTHYYTPVEETDMTDEQIAMIEKNRPIIFSNLSPANALSVHYQLTESETDDSYQLYLKYFAVSWLCSHIELKYPE